VPPFQRDACYSYFKKAIPAGTVVAIDPASVNADCDNGPRGNHPLVPYQ
jgi:hypothetical protein